MPVKISIEINEFVKIGQHFEIPFEHSSEQHRETLKDVSNEPDC